MACKFCGKEPRWSGNSLLAGRNARCELSPSKRHISLPNPPHSSIVALKLSFQLTSFMPVAAQPVVQALRVSMGYTKGIIAILSIDKINKKE